MKAPEVTSRAGITYRQLDYWTDQGYLQASEAHPGSGNGRTWEPREVVVAIVMARLTGAAVKAMEAAAIARLVAMGADSVRLAKGIRLSVTDADALWDLAEPTPGEAPHGPTAPSTPAPDPTTGETPPTAQEGTQG